jgi:hypothetical protein
MGSEEEIERLGSLAPNANGIKPTPVTSAVIRIVLSRSIEPCTIASRKDTPSSSIN